MKLFFLLMLSFLSLPGLGQEDDQKTIDEVQKAQVDRQKAVNKINYNFAGGEAPEFITKIKGLGHSSLKLSSLLDERVVKALQDALQKTGDDNLPFEMKRARIMGQVKGQPVEKIFLRFPKLLDIVTELITDKNAMSGLVRVLGQKDDLKIMGFIILFITFMGWFLQRILISKDWSFFQRFCLRLSFLVAFSALSMSVFYQYFRADIRPVFKIVSKHL